MGVCKEVKFVETDYIYADTNVFLNFLGYNDNMSMNRDCKELFSKAYNANAPIVLSRVAIDEIKKVLILSEFERNEYKGDRAIKNLHKKDPKQFNKILGQALNICDDYERRLKSNEAILDEIVTPDNETYKERDELMRNQNLFGVQDATHLAIAKQYGINYFATCDSDFSNVNIPGITILYNEAHKSKE